jgi:tripartite-type tricarboxylate transporter receptor subunit TctC
VNCTRSLMRASINHAPLRFDARVAPRERLNAEVRKALADPATRQRLIELGGAPAASTPAEMREFVEHEIAKWKRVISLRKIEQQ